MFICLSRQKSEEGFIDYIVKYEGVHSDLAMTVHVTVMQYQENDYLSAL